jgi:hypothetical protein
MIGRKERTGNPSRRAASVSLIVVISNAPIG